MNKNTLFKNSSTTYYYSSIFFPPKIRQKIATLYAYVRLADNYVDQTPQDYLGFAAFIHTTKNLLLEKESVKKKDLEKNTFLATSHPHIEHIKAYVQLIKQEKIPIKWLVSFLKSMKQDLDYSRQGIVYTTQKELDAYIYGSAEVIGLHMSAILKLPSKAYPFARLQGAAMQHINFIRDIAEDCNLHRQYLPLKEMKKHALKSICIPPIDTKETHAFTHFITTQIQKYYKKQKKAYKGYFYIPYRYRVPIATAAELYMWTAQTIEKNPTIVFKEKVKPSKIRVFYTFVKMLIHCVKYEKK